MMDLQQQAQIVAGIRKKFQESIGQRCFVKVNLGRSRINENVGTICQAHPKVFIVELEYRRGRTAQQSFQYSDILTGVVEVYQNHELMFGPFEIDPDAPLVSPEKRPQKKKRLRPVKPFEQRIRLSSEQVAMLAERLREEAKSAEGSDAHNRELVEELSRKFDKKMKLDNIVNDNVSATAEAGESLADIEEKIIGAINNSDDSLSKKRSKK